VAGTYTELRVFVMWEYTVEAGALADGDKRDPSTTFVVKMVWVFS